MEGAIDNATPIHKRKIEKAASRMSPELEGRLRDLADRLHDMALHVQDLNDGPFPASIEDALEELDERLGALHRAADALEIEIERG